MILPIRYKGQTTGYSGHYNSPDRSGFCRWSVGCTLLLSCCFLFFGCSKPKEDFTYDNSHPRYDPSAVRIINTAMYRQVIADYDSLTNFDKTGAPTRFFPGDGLLGRIWEIPKSLFAADEAYITLMGIQDYSAVPVQSRPVSLLIPGANKPKDYYTIWPGGVGQPEVVSIDRDIQASSKRDHFKIRIINLMKSVGALPSPGSTGALEDLSGPITLAYADGTPVSSQTSNISVEQRTSPYIEMPYGTYQFKILSADGREISATTHGVNEDDFEYRRLDPPTSRIVIPSTGGGVTGLTYAPIRTYQPGGVYTIVVAPFPFDYLLTSGSSQFAYQNQFKVIDDVPPPPNFNFARIQCVNALPGNYVDFRINGIPLSDVVRYGQGSGYQIVSANGEYVVEAQNSEGVELARVTHSIQAGQNHSVWLWQDAQGKVRLLPVANDMSTEFYSNRFDDNASVNRLEHTMALSTRHLNLSSDLPYLSYTINNGQDMRQYMTLQVPGAGSFYVEHSDDVMYNLRPGVPIVDLPYARWRVDYGVTFEWMAYRSTPGVTPGFWLDQIPVFRSTDLIARPALYTQVGRPLPAMEPGIFTVAVIGRTAEGASNIEKAKIIAVKHNQ